jgi:hypothetical protein
LIFEDLLLLHGVFWAVCVSVFFFGFHVFTSSLLLFYYLGFSFFYIWDLGWVYFFTAFNRTSKKWWKGFDKICKAVQNGQKLEEINCQMYLITGPRFGGNRNKRHLFNTPVSEAQKKRGRNGIDRQLKRSHK